MRDLTGIKTTTSFSEFRIKLAQKMGTQLSLLSFIGYIPSYKPKKPKPIPKLLEDEEAWEKLVDDVSDYITTSKRKKGGKGVVKTFSIAIVDTSGPGQKEATKVCFFLHPSNNYHMQLHREVRKSMQLLPRSSLTQA